MRSENGNHHPYRLAFVISDGIPEPEFIESVRVAKEAGASVDVIATHRDGVCAVRLQDGRAEQVELPVDKTLAEAKTDGYDAVLVPGHAVEGGRLRLEGDAKEFVLCMREAGKPAVCIPVPAEECPEDAAETGSACNWRASEGDFLAVVGY